jgi:hypothetical protein
MKSFKPLIIVLLLLVPYNYIFSQGCSDAGFCTISNLKTEYDIEKDKEKNNQVKLGLSNGKADHNIGILAAYIEYNRIVKEKLSFALKLTSISQSGEPANSAGLSDLFLSTTYLGLKNTDLTLGLKLPLSDGNKLKDGMPLPMDYQSSLGTVDLILGIGYAIKRLKLSLAYQQPLTQNKNTFLSEEYPVGSEFSSFQSTNKYIRKGDALLRVSYGIGNQDKLIITPSVLAIYHLGDDEYTDADGVKMVIDGSQGLTLNGNLFIGYSINESNMLELSIGAPFVTRKARPDGLTRKYVATLEYRFRF